MAPSRTSSPRPSKTSTTTQGRTSSCSSRARRRSRRLHRKRVPRLSRGPRRRSHARARRALLRLRPPPLRPLPLSPPPLRPLMSPPQRPSKTAGLLCSARPAARRARRPKRGPESPGAGAAMTSRPSGKHRSSSSWRCTPKSRSSPQSAGVGGSASMTALCVPCRSKSSRTPLLGASPPTCSSTGPGPSAPCQRLRWRPPTVTSRRP
mmetsp:Transcript_27623/g.80693  ORF Transcript_27623/g.80693 Transcript_27623/m.80693 type:complete len:207 (-) Transcript_27623:3018-3638(-)